MDKIKNYLTIDVEEHFQVSAFEGVVKKVDWGNHESRVTKNTETILHLLETAGVTATFFVVGWVAEKHPQLLQTIDKAGHEIGCHSYLHRKVYDLTPKEFREDTYKAKSILEDITGKKVYGYRAPSYSITEKSLWALKIIEELGFTYDSSIFPVYHDLYGIPGAPRFEYDIPGSTLKEFPISTKNLFGLNLPVSGGGYFRLFPYWFIKSQLKLINKNEGKPFMFYLHPWEVDPEQPRVKGVGLKSLFRHYNNLDKTSARFTSLLQDFRFESISARIAREENISFA